MVRFLLSDVEMISSHRIILFTCIKNRGVEIFNIDRIRFNLRFQTENEYAELAIFAADEV